jgi:acetyl esterase
LAGAPLHPVVAELAAEVARDDAARGRPPDLAELRAHYRRTAELRGGDPEPVAQVADTRIDGGPGARVYTPADARGTLVWFHGGGWVMGDLDGFDRAARALANSTGAVVLSVDYRLAPESPFPAAVHDADAALRWARSQLTGPVAVGGDSAGGNLAAVAARHARDAGAADLALQVLVYPVTDGAMDTASYVRFSDGPMLGAAEMRAFWAEYLGGADPLDPDASPLRASDLAGLAPAFVAVAGHDVLRDECEAYAARLRESGGAVTLRRYDDMAHGFLRWGGVVDRAHELIADIGAAVRAAMANTKGLSR